MLPIFKAALRGVNVIAVFAGLSCASALSLAQTPAGCAPGASGALPVVDTGLPVVQIWTTAGAPILDRETYVSACMRITDGKLLPYQQGIS